MRIIRTILALALALTASASAYSQTQYYGAIDLGSKGTKASLFSLSKTKCPVKPAGTLCAVYGKTINTQLVSSMKDGAFTDVGIQEATDAAKREIDEMQSQAKKYRLEVDYLIVGSSGVAKGKNKDALAASVKAATGIDMDFIDAKREGYFGLRSAVPTSNLFDSLYVDIGSGNTKLGCLVGGSDIGSFRNSEIEYGSVSGRNKGKEKNPTDIRAGIQQLMREDVGPAYDKASMDAPCLRNREVIYWTGGAAWAAATFTHPQEALKSEVRISRRDLDTFLARVGDGSWNQRHFQYSFSKDTSPEAQKDIRSAAEKDRRKVMDTFAGEDLLAGVSIMKTVLDSSNRSAVIWFVRDGGNFLLGYAAEKYPEKQANKRAPEADSIKKQ
jgi:hypothetical protein